MFLCACPCHVQHKGQDKPLQCELCLGVMWLLFSFSPQSSHTLEFLLPFLFLSLLFPFPFLSLSFFYPFFSLFHLLFPPPPQHCAPSQQHPVHQAWAAVIILAGPGHGWLLVAGRGHACDCSRALSLLEPQGLFLSSSGWGRSSCPGRLGSCQGGDAELQEPSGEGVLLQAGWMSAACLALAVSPRCSKPVPGSPLCICCPTRLLPLAPGCCQLLQRP